METRLVALKLFLDTLGISPDITTVNARKRVQKAVYLGQLTGVDLGYRFGWYLKGPYSPALTKDYYGLAEALETGDDEYKTKELKRSLVKQLRKVTPLMKPPVDTGLPLEDWLELVASVDYLQRVGKNTKKETIDQLKKEKPRLVKHYDEAVEALYHVGFNN